MNHGPAAILGEGSERVVPLKDLALTKGQELTIKIDGKALAEWVKGYTQGGTPPSTES
ncbi:hypothetical protein ICC18_14315 [Paenibacillus sp. WST5]|uniref:Uncharacterized protein n=1 Tax=Paenibacillus sedimenti TaxID=2770274 RepID=A0A926QJ31_9BACL|nr:hypothetical protein [Paenibacillus sedimenti]